MGRSVPHLKLCNRFSVVILVVGVRMGHCPAIHNPNYVPSFGHHCFSVVGEVCLYGTAENVLQETCLELGHVSTWAVRLGNNVSVDNIGSFK